MESIDLVSFLVLETSYYTQNQFKAFKTLQAYNQMVSGFIKSVEGHLISGNYIVIGKVRHSQKMNDPCVPLWIIANREGAILSAHCRGCMAGLGECCSHVASVLFYLEFLLIRACRVRVNSGVRRAISGYRSFCNTLKNFLDRLTRLRDPLTFL